MRHGQRLPSLLSCRYRRPWGQRAWQPVLWRQPPSSRTLAWRREHYARKGSAREEVLEKRGRSLVFCLLLGLVGALSALESSESALPLQTHRSDETLDFGTAQTGSTLVTPLPKEMDSLRLAASLGVGVVGVLRWHDLADDVLPHIILLGQVKQPPDLGSALGTPLLRNDGIGETWNGFRAGLDDHKGEDRDIGADDAAADGFATAFTISAWSVARVTLGEEEANTMG